MLAIEEMNRLAAAEFTAALRPLFEAAVPLAVALYAQRPFGSYEDVLDRAERIADRLPIAEQIEIVNAHPRIGESAESVRETSALSYAEQGYDAETALPVDEVQQVYRALAELNRQYEERFGFRFVVFVNGRPKSEIVTVLQERLHNTGDAELQKALRDMFLIARDRYEKLSVA